MLEQDTVEDLITKLRDMRFSNASTRMDFVKIISQLALAPDKTARKVIKKIGDFMSEFGTEILNNSSSTDETNRDNGKDEAYIINMDESKLYKRRFVEEDQTKYLYYTGSSAGTPSRFWTYHIFTRKEFEEFRKKHKDIPKDLKSIEVKDEKKIRQQYEVVN